jgi:hypothetical protein
MSTFSDFFPSKYWKPEDVEDNPVLLHIKQVMMETIGQPGKQERKPIMYFTKPDGGEVTKSLPLNVTNGKTLKGLYGDVPNWEGKPVVLFYTVVDVRGEQKAAIRLRAPKANGSASAERAAGATNKEVEDEIPF